MLISRSDDTDNFHFDQAGSVNAKVFIVARVIYEGSGMVYANTPVST
jgi:hypothetical protein